MHQSGPLAPVQLPLEASGEEKIFEGLEESSNVEDVVAFLSKKGLQVIDKRASGGSLWVLGGPELTQLMTELKCEGFKFTFAPSGGRVTHQAASWWMK